MDTVIADTVDMGTVVTADIVGTATVALVIVEEDIVGMVIVATVATADMGIVGIVVVALVSILLMYQGALLVFSNRVFIKCKIPFTCFIR